MLGISTLASAIARFAASLNALADTTTLANAHLRARLNLDEESEGPALLEAPIQATVPVPNGRKQKAGANGSA